MSQFELTPDQQRSTEKQILYEAELIRGGATISKLGQLVVTEAQRERLMRVDPYEEEIYEWLDTTVEDAFLTTGKLTAIETRCINALARDGATTFRHVLIRGAHRLSDLRNLGGKSGGALMDALQNDYGIELKEAPTFEEVVNYCRDVSEVDGGFISEKIRPGYSVKDILDTGSNEEILPMLSLRFQNAEDVQLKAADAIRRQATNFADQFGQVKHAK